MGRIVVVNFVSLDGVIQSPLSAEEDPSGGFDRGGWVTAYGDDVVSEFMSESTVSAAGLLLGARSYEILRVAWSEADEGEAAVAAMNRMPKHVVSRSLDHLAWDNSHRVEDGVPAGVAALRQATDGDLVVFGSGELVRGLAAHDLVDEYRLLLFPLVLGSGKRMFDTGAAPATFTLADATWSPSGVAILTYSRAT